MIKEYMIDVSGPARMAADLKTVNDDIIAQVKSRQEARTIRVRRYDDGNVRVVIHYNSTARPSQNLLAISWADDTNGWPGQKVRWHDLEIVNGRSLLWGITQSAAAVSKSKTVKKNKKK